MRGFGSIILLLFSNMFMTYAWYGHLRHQADNKWSFWGLFTIILSSWGIAFMEYCLMVPANRLGSAENGGPFNLFQLKIIQEAISLVVFMLFVIVFFKGESLKWNHLAGFFCIIMAVYFIFKS